MTFSRIYFTSEKSIANSRMSFGNANCTALLLVLCGSAITGAVWSDAEPAVHSLADVAHLRHLHRFELEIRSRSAEWYHEGMQLFTFSHTGFYWVKKNITWTVYNNTKSIPRARVDQIMADAFAKWAAVTTKTFQHVDYFEHKGAADIYIEFGFTDEHTKDRRRVCGLPKWPPVKKMDDGQGVIILEHRIDWSDTTSARWANLAFVALQLIGQILGLSNSECPGSIYHASNRGLEAKNDPKLHEDDIRGIQALYGAPPGWSTRTSARSNSASAPRPPPGPTSTFGRMNPVSAPRPSGWPTRSFGRTNPVSAPRSSSSSSDDDTTATTSSGGSSDDDDSSDDSD